MFKNKPILSPIQGFFFIILITSIILTGCSLNTNSIGTIATQNVDFGNIATQAMPTMPIPKIITATSQSQFQNQNIYPASTNSLTANLTEITGDVYTRSTGQSDYIKITDNYLIQSSAQVKTMDFSKVRLDISNSSIVRLGPNTLFTLEGTSTTATGNPLTKLRLDAGKLWVILRGGDLDVTTPSGVAAVRGSYLSVSVDNVTGAIYITCLEGQCSLKNNAGQVNLVSGETAKITNASLPPATGRMTLAEVNEWLQFNPEATQVILILTATSGALPPVTKTPVFLTATKVPGGTIPK